MKHTQLLSNADIDAARVYGASDSEKSSFSFCIIVAIAEHFFSSELQYFRSVNWLTRRRSKTLCFDLSTSQSILNCALIGITHIKNRSFTSPSTTLRVNRFLLCMCSPVLHKTLCGSFIESSKKELTINDVDGAAFSKALGMWCGKQDSAEMEMGEVRELASAADRFQVVRDGRGTTLKIF